MTRKCIIEKTKPSKETKLGLTLRGKLGLTLRGKEDIQIISINPGSLFDESELQIGMIIHKINKEIFSSYNDGVKLLKEAEGDLTIEASFPEKPQPLENCQNGKWSLDEIRLLSKGLEVYGVCCLDRRTRGGFTEVYGANAGWKELAGVQAGFIRSKTTSQVRTKLYDLRPY